MLIYFRRNNILVAGKRIAAAKLSISADSVNNMEVLDTEKFIESCQKFFSSRKVHGKRALLVLDQSIVFTKTVDIGKDDDPRQIVNDFIEAMPLGPGKRVCAQFREENRLYIFATNAELYQPVVEALRLSGIGKLTAITPAAAYKLASSTAGTAVDKFLNDKEIREKIDFSSITPL